MIKQQTFSSARAQSLEKTERLVWASLDYPTTLIRISYATMGIYDDESESAWNT